MLHVHRPDLVLSHLAQAGSICTLKTYNILLMFPITAKSHPQSDPSIVTQVVESSIIIYYQRVVIYCTLMNSVFI